DVLGNFVSRVTKFAKSKLGETVPAAGDYGPQEAALIADLGTRIRDYERFMDQMEVRKAAGELRAIWVIGNEYLQSAAPWSMIKTDPAQAEAIIRLSLNLIRLYAILSRPFIPDAAEAMMAAMGSDDWSWPTDAGAALRALPAGHAFTVPENLFRKITDEERADWQQKFAGVRG
ncbi:MAG TPA: methionine--tRNA ligase, partial [Gemmobacter sp.]|nr:methionine--tRNA ligase [Gemmobacter sp.]